MANARQQTAKARVDRLKDENARLTFERDDAIASRDQAHRERAEAVRMANDATEAVRRAEREFSKKLEAAEGRIVDLKLTCAGLEREISERDGYIRRVNEQDDAGAPLAVSQPAPTYPRTKLARDAAPASAPNGSDAFAVDGGARPHSRWFFA